MDCVCDSRDFSLQALDLWMAGCMVFVFAALGEFVVVKVLDVQYQYQINRLPKVLPMVSVNTVCPCPYSCPFHVVVIVNAQAHTAHACNIVHTTQWRWCTALHTFFSCFLLDSLPI